MNPSDQDNDAKRTARFLAELAPSSFEHTVLNDDWLNVQPKSRIIKALKILGTRLQDASTANIDQTELSERINMSIFTTDRDHASLEVVVPSGLNANSAQSETDWDLELIPRGEEHPYLHVKIKGDFTIGRSRTGKPVDLDLTPYGASLFGVSGQHAAVRVKSDGLYLLDLNSTNGTYYRKQKVDPSSAVKIEEGTVVAFGKLVFLVSKIKQLKR